jgi:hypothetical protein
MTADNASTDPGSTMPGPVNSGPSAEALRVRLRRLRRTLADLGLDRIVGTKWVTLGEQAPGSPGGGASTPPPAVAGPAPGLVFSFADLSPTAVDRLLCHLEDIADVMAPLASSSYSPTDFATGELFIVPVPTPVGYSSVHPAVMA